MHMKQHTIERLTVGMVALLLIVLNVGMVMKYDATLSVVAEDYAKRLSYLFHVSGFDPNSYAIMTHWDMHYDVVRHPLMAWMMSPFAWLNHLLIAWFGTNAALYIAAVIDVVCGTLSARLCFRLLHRVVETTAVDASLLTLLLFSLGYVQVTFFVPDHFAVSLMLILLTLYHVGMKMKTRQPLSARHTAWLFIATAGVTLTNGAKVLAAAWVARGRRFFQWRYLLLGVVAPVGLVMGVALAEQRIYVYPKQQEAKQYFEAHKAEMMHQARINHERYKHAPWVIHKGHPIGDGELLKWTDTTTSRWDTMVENVFGESLILHETHVLEDVLSSYRPVLLKYNAPWCYGIEALIVVLWIVGIWMGRRCHVLWMALLGIVPDALMHLVLGFAINEVYIMTAHWVYVVPIAMACLTNRIAGKQRLWLRSMIALLVVWLLQHNLSTIMAWMQSPIVSTAFWFE